MIFIRRDRRPPGRLAAWRVGLFFLAAGTWLAGVLTENSMVTGAAIVVALVGVVLGFVDRPPEEPR